MYTVSDLPKFLVKVSYDETIVHAEVPDFRPGGLWIYYGDPIITALVDAPNSSGSLMKLKLPMVQPTPDNKSLLKILENTNQGFAICFDYDKLSLTVTRHCQARLFVTNSFYKGWPLPRSIALDAWSYECLRSTPVTESTFQVFVISVCCFEF